MGRECAKNRPHRLTDSSVAVYESIGKRAVLVIPGIWRCWVAQVVAWRPEIEVVARAKPRRVAPRIVRAHRLPAVILERFVFVPECRGDRHAARTRDRVLPPRGEITIPRVRFAA